MDNFTNQSGVTQLQEVSISPMLTVTAFIFCAVFVLGICMRLICIWSIKSVMRSEQGDRETPPRFEAAPNHAIGLPEKLVQGFLTSSFDALNTQDLSLKGCDSTCVVCLGEYERSDLLRKLPCNHYFHIDCVDSWLKSHTTCPLCRTCFLEHSEAVKIDIEAPQVTLAGTVAQQEEGGDPRQQVTAVSMQQHPLSG